MLTMVNIMMVNLCFVVYFNLILILELTNSSINGKNSKNGKSAMPPPQQRIVKPKVSCLNLFFCF